MTVLSPPSVAGEARCASHRKAGKALPCINCAAKSFNFCRPLDYERQKELFEIGVQHSWSKRQALFRAGDPIGAVFKITSGMVAVSKALPDGRRQVLDFLLPGDMCGFFETGDRYAFDCEAVTEATTCSFNRARLLAFAAEHPDVADAIRDAIADRLQRTAQHMAVIGQLSSTERVANFLCTLSASYSEHDIQTRPLALPMKRTDIADYLGLRLETVSRAFSKLRKRKYIEMSDDDFVVIDPVALSRISSDSQLWG
jgi:CRP/FNR family transcriptional regulator